MVARMTGDRQTYAKVGDDWVPVIHLLDLEEGATVELARMKTQGVHQKVGDDWVPVATLIDSAGNPYSPTAAAEAVNAAEYPQFKAGQFIAFHNHRYGGDFTSSARLANILHLTPFTVPFPVSVDRVDIEVVTTPSSAGTGARIGVAVLHDIWEATLETDYGTVLTDSTGIKELTIADDFVPGVLYGALVATEANVTLRSHTKSADLFGGPTGGGASTFPSLTVAHAYAALPAGVTFTDSSLAPIAVRFRVA